MKVCLDSRLIQKGDYFVPVKGENFDGHDFIDVAYKNGAIGVIEESELYKMAQEKLTRIKPTVIAITGSVGKTTMRDFVSTLLSEKYSVCKGTLNTKLGLATNIVNDLKDTDQFFVAEAGMDHAGELRETSEFLRPDAVVITEISESHMEKLGSLQAIKNAKAEIFEFMNPTGKAFLNWDNQNIRDISIKIPSGVKVIKYEISSTSNINEVGAQVVALNFGLSSDELSLGSSKLKLPKGRLNILEGISGSILIDDSYNASPVSTKNAIQFLMKYDPDGGLRKIMVFGGMLELGTYEDQGHKEVGDFIASDGPSQSRGVDILALVGPLAQKVLSSDKLKNSDIQIISVQDSIEAGEYLRDTLKIGENDIILFKASQSIRIEKAIKIVLKDPSRASELLVRQDARWLN